MDPRHPFDTSNTLLIMLTCNIQNWNQPYYDQRVCYCIWRPGLGQWISRGPSKIACINIYVTESWKFHRSGVSKEGLGWLCSLPSFMITKCRVVISVPDTPLQHLRHPRTLQTKTLHLVLLPKHSKQKHTKAIAQKPNKIKPAWYPIL